MGLQKRMNVLWIWDVVIWFSSPTICAVASLGMYQYFNAELTTANMLLAMTLFISIGEPLDAIPEGVYGISHILVSMKRITKFLLQDEIIPERIKTDENDYAIKIENSSFTWGKPVKSNKINDKIGEKEKNRQVKDEEDEDSDNDSKGSNESEGSDNEEAENKIENIEADNSDSIIFPSNENSNKSDINSHATENQNNKLIINQNSFLTNDKSSTPSFISNSDKPNTTENNNPNNESTQNLKSEESVSESQNFQQVFRCTNIEVQPPSKSKISEIKTHLKNISISISKGELIGVIGEVGSCKSTLLNAFLNNLIPLNNNNKGDITINGQISYITQTPWIRNETLKNNILFLREYNEVKYNRILDICQLRQDIEVLQSGDATEIGEKGINLSGGQKARVAIARAMYSDSDIYLFDDPLSALDAHVGDSIFTDCILNELKSKTRVLVTNSYQFLKYMNRVIFMKDGEIEFIGSYEELVEHKYIDRVHFTENQEKRKRAKSIEEIGDEIELNGDSELIKKLKEEKKLNQKMTSEEDRETGFVKFQVYLDYFKYNGGYMFTFIIIFSK